MATEVVCFQPPVEELDELVKALEQFVWHDEGYFNLCPMVQEKQRLPGFVRVVEALRPLRAVEETTGWPAWLAGLLHAVIKTFDILAYSWGWGELLKPAADRAAYIKRREEGFRESYLVPIHEAAKACRKDLSVIDCPAYLEDLCEAVPPIEFDLIFFDEHQERLKPLREAVYRKRNAFLLGESFPKMSDVSGGAINFTPDAVLGDTLKSAAQKLKYLVGKAAPVSSTTDSAIACRDVGSPGDGSGRQPDGPAIGTPPVEVRGSEGSGQPAESIDAAPADDLAANEQAGGADLPGARRIFYEPLRGQGAAPGIAWLVFDDSMPLYKGTRRGRGSHSFWREVLSRTRDGIWIKFQETPDGPWRHAGHAHPFWQVSLQEVSQWFSANGEPPPEILFEDIARESRREAASRPGQAGPDVTSEEPRASSGGAHAMSLAISPPRSRPRSQAVQSKPARRGSGRARVDPWLVTSSLAAFVAMLTAGLVLHWPAWKGTWMLIAGEVVFITTMLRHPEHWYRRIATLMLLAAISLASLPMLQASGAIHNVGRFSIVIDNTPWVSLSLVVGAVAVIFLDWRSHHGVTSNRAIADAPRPDEDADSISL